MKRSLAAAAAIGLLVLIQGAGAEPNQRFGVGVNYWKTLKDVDIQNLDKNGVSWLASCQFMPAGLLKVEADLEVFPKGFQGIDENVYAPEAYVVVGSGIYGGAGIGILYADGEFSDSPFYALRAGFQIELLPGICLDLNGNYRFEKWGKLSGLADDISVDTVTLGAAVRVEF